MDNRPAERSKFESGISDEQAVEIAPELDALTRSPAWAAYRELLTASRLRARELGFDNPENIQHYVGFVAGLGVALQLPLLVVQQATDAANREEKRGKMAGFRGGLRSDSDPSV